MTRKNQWRAKLMALMARDGDIESLAEMITELANAAEASAGAPAAPEAGENPMAAAVRAAAEKEAPAHAAGAADPGADPAAAGESTARGTDCGPEILEVLQRIAELLEANALRDCGPAAHRQDERAEITAAAAETVTETAPAEAAEALAETAARVLGAAGTQAEPDSAAAESAEALAEAAAQALGIPVPAEPGADEDPVEELVAGVLAEIDPPASPAAEAVQAEILSAVLEPDQDSGDADPEEAADPARAADALRTALAAFRPHLERMTPKERLRFNADFSARMRKLLRASDAASGRPSPYAAIRGAAARREDVRDLGRKIMEARNINLRG